MNYFGAIAMETIKKRRKLFFLLSLIVIIACGPQIVYQSGDSLLKSDEPIWENDKNKLRYGYRNSTYIKRIWPQKLPAVITAMGDVALNFAVMKDIIDHKKKKHGKEYAWKYPFSKVKRQLQGIVFCNLEAPITSEELKVFSDKDEIFYFKSPPDSVNMLTKGGFDIVSLANNHAKDCGVKGLFDTRKRLHRNNIAVAGVGKNIIDALKPVYMWHRGTRVAFFAFDRVIPKSVWASPNRAGVAGGSDELLVEAVKSVKDKVDAIVVSIHWGKEVIRDIPVEKPHRSQVALGHKLIDAGASVILGHQSHGLGPVERYGKGIIFYSLGDFVFAGRHSASHRTSMMVRVSLSERGLESYTIIPVNNNPLKVRYRPVILNALRGTPVINRVLRKKDSRYRSFYASKKKRKR